MVHRGNSSLTNQPKRLNSSEIKSFWFYNVFLSVFVREFKLLSVKVLDFSKLLKIFLAQAVLDKPIIFLIFETETNLLWRTRLNLLLLAEEAGQQPM